MRLQEGKTRKETARALGYPSTERVRQLEASLCRDLAAQVVSQWEPVDGFASDGVTDDDPVISAELLKELGLDPAKSPRAGVRMSRR